MDALIETFDESTLRDIVKDILVTKDGALFKLFVEQGSKMELIRIINEMGSRYLVILKMFVRKGDISILTKIVSVLDIGQYSEIINHVKNQATCDFLLMNGLELDKVASLDPSVEELVINSITTKVLTKPFNPNRRISVRNIVFWRDMTTYERVMKLIKYNGPNFSHILDINAASNDGNTLLHSIVNEYLAELLKYNPDQTIKNNEGKTPYEHRKHNRVSVEGLIASNESERLVVTISNANAIISDANDRIDYQKRALAYEERNHELLKENEVLLTEKNQLAGLVEEQIKCIKTLEEQLQEKASLVAKLQNILS